MPNKPKHYYQAVGVVTGILTIDDESGFPIILTPSSFVAAYATKQVRKKHQPEKNQHFLAYPCIRHKQPALHLIAVTDAKPTSFKLHGCWELYKGEPHFVIYRNGLKPGQHINRSLVPVHWADAPEADGQFWQAEAEIKFGEFTITKAEGPFEPPPKATKYIPPTSTTTNSEAPAPAVTFTAKEIRAMATPAKAQVTCKFSEVPRYQELDNKLIEFFLRDGESDRIFAVRMKPKMFKKLTDHGFVEWVAALTGDIGPATETGFELVNASVQVFERKPKDDSTTPVEAKEKADAETKPAAAELEKGEAEAGEGQAKADAGAKPKKKGLLDGVRVR